MNTNAFKRGVAVNVDAEFETKVGHLLAEVQAYVPESNITAILQSTDTPSTFIVMATVRPDYPHNPEHSHTMRFTITYDSRYAGFKVLAAHFETNPPKNCHCYDSLVTAEGLIDQIHRSVIMADD